jgi:cytochrome P450
MWDCDVLEECDLLERAPYLDDPYPFYARLRRRADWLAPYGSEGVLVAARAAAVETVLNTSEMGTPHISEVLSAPVGDQLLSGFYSKLVRWREDPRSQALRRRLVFPLQEASGVRWRQRAAVVASCLADDLLTSVSGMSVETFCRRLPVAALAHLMGAPLKIALSLDGAIERLAAPLSPFAEPIARAHLEEDYKQASGALMQHIGFLDDDFGGAAPGVSADDLLANMIGLYLQAHDATQGLLLLSIAHLMSGHGRGLDLLQQPIRSAFLEEVERFDPPVQLTTRIARKRTIMRGLTVPAGTKVILLIGAANRDPDANFEPDRFDLYRANRRSFSFSGGRHACPGRRIAMTIADVGLETILQRYPSLETALVQDGFQRSHNARKPIFRDRSR